MAENANPTLTIFLKRGYTRFFAFYTWCADPVKSAVRKRQAYVL